MSNNPSTRQSARVHIDGADVPYHVAGRARDGQPPLLLVHGSTGSTDSHFGYLFPMLAFDRQVISLDLTAPAGGTVLELQHLVRQVEAVAQAATGGGTVDLLGYSLGAVVAASVAAAQRLPVRALVLVAGWARTDNQQRLRNGIWRELRAAGSPALRNFMLFGAFSAGFLALRSEAELADMAGRIAVDTFVDQQMALNTRIDISDEVARIRAATLVIGCSQDQMVPPAHARLLFGAIDNARYTEVDAGHAVVFERPPELLCHIGRFLDDPAAVPAGHVIPPVQP